ncbi:MAG: sulfite exporter TauE/SafE family protein [Azospirillum sp.]|nr:sulfite exporter TauE/SafE family protein [Azospirillum sp.]
MDQAQILAVLEAGLSHCRVVLTDHGGLFATLFAAGLVGGTSHCAGMCGPFVLAQVATRLEAVPAARMSEFHRLAGAALVPYHLGRATSYAAIGAVAASVTGSLGTLPGLPIVSAVLLALAALFFLMSALNGIGVWLPEFDSALLRRWSDLVGRLARPLFVAPLGWRGYALGLALGFIPCGLLYGAVAVAAASADPIAGAFGMAAFVAGTVPSLIAVGLAGHLAGRAWHAAVARAAPVIMAVNAGVLGFMAYRQIF